MTYIDAVSIIGALMGGGFVGFTIGFLVRIDDRIKKIMDKLEIKEDE